MEHQDEDREEVSMTKPSPNLRPLYNTGLKSTKYDPGSAATPAGYEREELFTKRGPGFVIFAATCQGGADDDLHVYEGRRTMARPPVRLRTMCRRVYMY